MKFKYILILFIMLIIVAAVAYVGYKLYHRMHRSQVQESFKQGAGTGQSKTQENREGQIPQIGNLCGNTNGNGQIVSVGNNKFTLKQNDGRNRIIHLSDNATIKSSSGSATITDLKPGFRVTLVGGSNFDGSFTTDVVLVCNKK